MARFCSLYTEDEDDNDNDKHSINAGKGKKQKLATRDTQNARKGRYKSKAIINNDDLVVEIPEVSGKRKADQSLTDEEDASGKYIYTSYFWLMLITICTDLKPKKLLKLPSSEGIKNSTGELEVILKRKAAQSLTDEEDAGSKYIYTSYSRLTLITICTDLKSKKLLKLPSNEDTKNSTGDSEVIPAPMGGNSHPKPRPFTGKLKSLSKCYHLTPLHRDGITADTPSNDHCRTPPTPSPVPGPFKATSTSQGLTSAT